MSSGVGPAAEGVRVDWSELPVAVRAGIGDVCGSPVESVRTQRGGFSPGVAARVCCVDGQRYFVKAVCEEPNAQSYRAHRREAEVLAELGRLPGAGTLRFPALRGIFDDGLWVALVLEDVDGHQPVLPWQAGELARVVSALQQMAEVLTPPPIAAAAAQDAYADSFMGWRKLGEADGSLADQLDPWSRRHLERLADVELTWPQYAAGQTLLHTDLRADNLLITRDCVVVVDWPWACVGSPLLDLVGFAPSVKMQGGPDPAELLRMTVAGRGADPDAVAALACALAGYFTEAARNPAPPGLPTLRAFQAAQGVVARRWVADLLRLR